MTKSMPALKRVSSIHRTEAQCHCVKTHVPECATAEKHCVIPGKVGE